MKRILTDISYDDLNCEFTSTRIFRSDLEEIIEIAKKSKYKIHISDNDCIYDNLDELKTEKGELINCLNIKLESTLISHEYNKYIKIIINANKIRLTVDKRVDLQEVYLRIKQILAKRKNKWAPTFLSAFSYVSLTIYFLLPLAIGDASKRTHELTNKQIVFILAPLFIYFIIRIYLFIHGKIYRGLNLKKEHEQSNLFFKHLEKIFYMFLGVSLSSLYSFVSYLIK